MTKITAGLTTKEWLSLIGIFIVATASVTVFAYNTFEASGSADKVKKELKGDMIRVERKVDALLLNRNLNPKLYEAP